MVDIRICHGLLLYPHLNRDTSLHSIVIRLWYRCSSDGPTLQIDRYFLTTRSTMH